MWENKWVRIGLGILVAVVVICGVFYGGTVWGGKDSGTKPTAPAPAVGAPTPQPTPSVTGNVTVNQTVNQSQTVSGNGTENSSQTPTATAAAPTATPAPKSAVTAQPITGNFKASVYRQSDGWFLNSFRGEPVIDTGSGPLSRVEDVVRWTGTFSAPTAGKYQFDYPDGADLYVDGTRIIAPVYLTKGNHKLAFGPLLLNPADGSVRLLWQKIS